MSGKIYLLVLLAAILPQNLISQIDISGKITCENGEILSGANIVLENTFIATSSGLNGEFVLKDLKNGSYSLLVSYIGYEQ